MNIFDHLIPDDAILGIGPLMMEHHPSMENQIVYGTRRYFFELHLPAHSITVKSDWFTPKENTEQQEQMAKWKEVYNTIRLKVAMMIKVDDVTMLDKRKEHINQVGEVYEDLKQQLHFLFADLQPADFNQQPVIPRIEKVYESVSQLRDLACK